MDSVSEDTMQWLQAADSTVGIHKFAAAKDYTDGELALRLART